MKRHPALIPLTHDHHHALAQARRLREAAAGPAGERLTTAQGFVAFFRAEAVPHFREEEELLFPLLVAHVDPVPALLGQVLLEHVRIHALVHRLASECAAGDATEAGCREPAELLAAHIRLEEGELFPLIEAEVPDQLAGLAFSPRHRSQPTL